MNKRAFGVNSRGEAATLYTFENKNGWNGTNTILIRIFIVFVHIVLHNLYLTIILRC